MAVSASFASATHILSVFGDALANTLRVSRNATGKLLVNGGAVTVVGDQPTVANTSLIQIFGQDGDDTITLDETNGALPAANLFGGAGNDVLTGGSGNDTLFGQSGDDTLKGGGGDDLLFGGDGDDVLIGGPGSDQVFGGAGDDRMIWNPGDGSDLFEGGDGNDTAEVNGGNGDETFTITANGSRVRFDRIDPAPFSLDIGTTENLVVRANGGNDVITAGNGLAGLINLTLDGGAGDDTITGGDGNDLLLGGSGDDIVTGGRGADTALLGSGNDTFIWNPGDGSDTVDGQSGLDTLLFNGSNVAERIDIAANGGRVRFTRDVGNVTMDLNSIETIDFAARGGADSVTVHDLSGTGVKQVAVDLAGTPGSGAGDGSSDAVTVEGRAGGDHIVITNSGASIAVNGLPAAVTLAGAEAFDTLTVEGLGGSDHIDASALQAGAIGLTIDGGAGNDTITGGSGNDVLIGGDGNDVVTGGRGDDVALLGAGDDRFVWNPGDGSDTVEGQAGFDTLLFNGSDASETFDISANGSRARLFRDVGAVTMDLNGVEQIKLATLGGADAVTVNDLTGTDVTRVAIDFAGQGGGGDGAADQAIVNGSAGADAIKIGSSGGVIKVSGLAALTSIANAEGGLDSLTVNGLGGADTINASNLAAGLVNLTIDGGDGDDLITGSAGADTVIGGRGNDTAWLGGGDDTYIWNPGDGSDTVEGQAGVDTLLFNGSNVAENIDISANGGRVRFTRDVGNVVMDLNGVEHIDFAGKGGADNVTVNDLSGTDVTDVAIDLGDDGAADTVTVNATGGDDVVRIVNTGGVVTVTGLSATVTIANFDASDRLVVNGLGGDDVINASGFNAALQLTLAGGDGADVLIGGLGADVLLGGAGNDVLNGGGGLDVLDGGTGDNIIQGSAVFAQPGGLASAAAATLVLPAPTSALLASEPSTLAQPHA